MSSTTTTANAAPASTATKAAPSSAGKNLVGLFPYLARYPGAIALGMVALVLTSLVGNIIPLATGVMTDIVAGSAHPFETSTHGNVLAVAIGQGPVSYVWRAPQVRTISSIAPVQTQPRLASDGTNALLVWKEELPSGRLVAQLPAGRPTPQAIVVVLDWPSSLPKP